VTPGPQIFVSAVSRELASARQRVANSLIFLGYEPIWQDIFGTESGDLREMLREKIDTCKGLVQLVGQCYGSEPPSLDEQFGRVSYTQFEALYARKRGKRVWYLLLDQTFPVDTPLQEPIELKELQAAYRRRLQNETQVFQPVNTNEGLEVIVLRMRDDLGPLRRWTKLWATAVVALLLLIFATTIRYGGTTRQQSALNEKMLQAVERLADVERQLQQSPLERLADVKKQLQQSPLERLADVERQLQQSRSKLSAEDRRSMAYAFLEKDLGLPAGVLAQKLPAFALELYNRPETNALDRARAAYALNRFDEAEKLGLESAAQNRQAVQSAERVWGEQRKQAVESYILAGQSARQLIHYDKAMEHLREAEKLTDRTTTPEEWAAVQSAIGDVLIDEGKYTDATNVLLAAVETRTNVLGTEHPDTLKSRSHLALALLRTGNYAASEKQCRDILALEEKILGIDNPETLSSKNTLGLALYHQDKNAEAEAQYRELIKLQEKVLGPEDPKTLATRDNLGITLQDQGKYSEAEAQYRDVLKLEEKVLGLEHPGTLQTRNNLAGALYGQGKYSEVESIFRELIKIEEKILGPEHPDTLMMRMNLALSLNDQGKSAEAEALYREVITIETKVLGPEHPNTLMSRTNFAEALGDQGKYAEAEAENREATKLEEKVLGLGHGLTLTSLTNLTNVLQVQGKYAEAENHCREVISLATKILEPHHPITLVNRANLASVLNDEGKHSEAKLELPEIIGLLATAFQNPEHRLVLAARFTLAKIFADLEEYGAAEQEYREVITLQEKTLRVDHPDTLKSCYYFATALAKEKRFAEARQFAFRAATGARKVLRPGHPSIKEYDKFLAEVEAEH